MPYKSIEELPESVKKLSAEAQKMWMDVFNNAYKEYNGDEEKCFATAWAAVKKKYSMMEALESADGGFSVQLAFQQPKNLNFTDESNGDTVFHDVILMAEGVWQDNYSKTKIRYTANQLASMEWKRKTIKMDHDIFNKLPITNEIGVIENERFQMHPVARWVGDVRIFPTTNGKDTVTLLKRKQINAISPEMFVQNAKRGDDGITEGDGLVGMGAATVRQGACSLCKFNEGDETTAEDKPNIESQLESVKNEKTAEVKALEAQLEAVKKQKTDQAAAELESLKIKNTELQALVVALQKKAAEQEQAAQLKELQRQIEAYSAQPVMHTRMAGMPVELKSDPDYYDVSVRDLDREA